MCLENKIVYICGLDDTYLIEIIHFDCWFDVGKFGSWKVNLYVLNWTIFLHESEFNYQEITEVEIRFEM